MANWFLRAIRRDTGTTPDFLDVKSLKVGRGRFLNELDMSTGTNVAVLAAGAAQKLFNFEDPIGKSVRLGTMVFRIVGVLRPQGSGTAVAGGIGGGLLWALVTYVFAGIPFIPVDLDKPLSHSRCRETVVVPSGP